MEAEAMELEDKDGGGGDSKHASDVDQRVVQGIAVIAEPLAGPKLTKKCLKLVKRASKVKMLRRGVKEVVKALRKKEKGVMILAGNITPIDVISHLPVLCEEKAIPFLFVPSKEDLGTAGGTKRPTSCVLIREPTSANDEQTKFVASFNKCKEKILKLNPLT